MNNTRLNKKRYEYHHPVKRKTTTSKVRFDPVYLERVCLFRQDQVPNELKVDTQMPPFRLFCFQWPPTDTIIIHKKDMILKDMCLKGKIMVKNLALDKTVSVQYTFDDWQTRREVETTFFGPYLKNESYDIYEFSFEVEFVDRGEIRSTIQFQVHLSAENNEQLSPEYTCKVVADPLNFPLPMDHITDSSSSDQFNTALKGYQHAKLPHLNKRPPWLGTRYDFSQSLSLARRYPADKWADQPVVNPQLELNELLDKYCFYTSSDESISKQ
ncbi:hypothetical protein BDB01DRAFT_730538 [Pilobolus umbonatus]|nr:hypothetical protein BDB01DRAFT_730538 [Pilobolus umbonatus]